MKPFQCLLTIILMSLTGLSSWGQNALDSQVYSDSTVHVYISSSSSDNVIVHHTDTIFIKQSASEGSGESVEKVAEDVVDPRSVLNVISVGKIIWSLIFLMIAYFVIKTLTRLLNIVAERSARHRITVKGFIPILRVMGWIFAIYIVIGGVIHPPAETIIAVAASIGIAVGFAAQDILRNIFGGFMIIMDRPFKVGDKVEIGNYYGEVVEIGLRSTQIVTPDDSLVSVPNGEMMNHAVSNANAGEPNCQVVAEIFLPITVNTDKVRKIALEAAQVSRYVYLNKPIRVLFFNEMHERRSYLKMRLKAYVLDIRDEFNFKSDMTEIVLDELVKQKVVNPEDLV
jgi:small-conductance mechanosensitive channel